VEAKKYTVEAFNDPKTLLFLTVGLCIHFVFVVGGTVVLSLRFGLNFSYTVLVSLHFVFAFTHFELVSHQKAVSC
jgi:hypothetical protein